MQLQCCLWFLYMAALHFKSRTIFLAFTLKFPLSSLLTIFFVVSVCTLTTYTVSSSQVFCFVPYLARLIFVVLVHVFSVFFCAAPVCYYISVSLRVSVICLDSRYRQTCFWRFCVLCFANLWKVFIILRRRLSRLRTFCIRRHFTAVSSRLAGFMRWAVCLQTRISCLSSAGQTEQRESYLLNSQPQW